MDKKRKETIVNEIRYWKKNRLLPEKYCDYLLALYTEGTDEQINSDIKIKNKKQRNFIDLIFMLFNLTFVPLVALIIFFSELDLIYSVGIILISCFIAISLYFIAIKYFKIDREYALIVLLINFFMLSFLMIEQWINHSFLGIAIIFVQLLMWIMIGIKQSSKLLLAISTLGIIISIAVLII